MAFSESDRQRSLSHKTGYLFCLYKKMEAIEQELKIIMHFMREYKPWFDSDDLHPFLPHPPNEFNN